MRNLLRREGKRKFNPGTAASMFFLNATDPATIKLAKTMMIDIGYRVQRLAYAVGEEARARARADARIRRRRPAARRSRRR